MDKKLRRSKSDKKIAGVCGGFANFFKIDATLIRLGWAVLSFLYGAGILIYLICCFVIPEEGEEQ